jgi:hypothetical protein
MQLDFADRAGALECRVTDVDLRLRPKIGVETHIHFMARVIETQVHGSVFRDQLPAVHSLDVGDFDVEHDLAGRQLVFLEVAMDKPHEPAGMKLGESQVQILDLNGRH